jgi:hypothetical protein
LINLYDPIAPPVILPEDPNVTPQVAQFPLPPNKTKSDILDCCAMAVRETKRRKKIETPSNKLHG